MNKLRIVLFLLVVWYFPFSLLDGSINGRSTIGYVIVYELLYVPFWHFTNKLSGLGFSITDELFFASIFLLPCFIFTCLLIYRVGKHLSRFRCKGVS